MVERPTRRLAAPLLAGLLLAAPTVRAEEVIRVSGTGTALGPLGRLARAFEEAEPGVKVRLLPSVGSSGAVKAVASGALDLGMSGRPLRPDEAASGILAEEVARTPFLLAVGPRTGATGLTAAELVRIYRGEATAWPTGERIRPVLRPASDADTLYLRGLSPALEQALDAALARPGLLVAATNQECDALVARTPGAIGPSTLAQLATGAERLTPLDWDGVAPTLANLRSGRYPLSKPLVALLPASPSPAARRFLAFVRSPAGQRLLEASGCAPSAAPAGG